MIIAVNADFVCLIFFQVKNHMWLFVNCLIENPSFDSQTKENMTLQQKSFGSTCTLSEKFIKQVRLITWLHNGQNGSLVIDMPYNTINTLENQKYDWVKH